MADDAQAGAGRVQIHRRAATAHRDEGVLAHKVLVEGFVYEGQRVPTHGPQGIFKSRVLREIPRSVTTVAVVDGETRPYDDAFGEDCLLQYRYRRTDPRHHENVGLRLAMQGAGMLVACTSTPVASRDSAARGRSFRCSHCADDRSIRHVAVGGPARTRILGTTGRIGFRRSRGQRRGCRRLRSPTGAIATATWTSFCGVARPSRLSR
jgi:hypothetical protein